MGPRLALGIGLACVASACSDGGSTRAWRPSDHAQPPGVSATTTPTAPVARVSPEDARLRAGGALFRTHCATCHGEAGRGDGPQRSAAINPTDLTTAAFQDSRADDALMTVIASGRGAMPGFARELDETGLVAIVAYVRSLRAATAPSPQDEARPAGTPTPVP